MKQAYPTKSKLSFSDEVFLKQLKGFIFSVPVSVSGIYRVLTNVS